MKRRELFRLRSMEPPSRKKLLEKMAANDLESPKISRDFSECGFHCPPNCPYLAAGKCPDTD